MKEIHEIIPILVDAPYDLKTVNFYLIKTESNLILVDAGYNNEACMNALIETLKENQLSLYDLTGIVLTHNHHDHVGLVNSITEKHNIPIYTHMKAIPRLKRDREFLEMRVAFYMNLYQEMGCGEAGDKQATHLRNAIEKNSKQAINGDIKPIGKKFLHFDVIEVPGHAPDQIALYCAQTKELIAGDLIIEHISSNALVEPDDNGNRLPTLTQHKQSLEKIQSLDIKVIYPGHGGIIDNPKELIRKRLEGIDNKVARFKNMLESAPLSANDLAIKYYKKSYQSQFSLVMSEIIGHLDYMEKNAQIKKEMKDGVWYYSAVKNKVG